MSATALATGGSTDEKRFYFVLEPPKPPPPDPDMDAIRKELEVKPDVVKQPAKTHTKPLRQPKKRSPPTSQWPNRQADSHARRRPRGAKRILHFRDQRPPHEIQFALERDLMVLFTPVMENGRLTLVAKPRPTGADYHVVLHFEAALPGKNCYSLHAQTSWERNSQRRITTTTGRPLVVGSAYGRAISGVPVHPSPVRDRLPHTKGCAKHPCGQRCIWIRSLRCSRPLSGR